MSRWEDQHIVLCDTCNGSGQIECSEVTDYHKNERRYWNVECKTCNGSGRMIKTTIVEMVPFELKTDE